VEPEDAQETPAAEVPKLDSVESGGDCHDDDGAGGNAAVADAVKTPAAVRAPKSTSTSTRASQAPPVGAASAAASTLSETLAVRLSSPPNSSVFPRSALVHSPAVPARPRQHAHVASLGAYVPPLYPAMWVVRWVVRWMVM
jgi:hypothetical protein